MTLTEIANMRLANQQVGSPQSNSIKGLVGKMGAMQAQDFNMAKWAVGIRVLGATDASVQQALDDADIIRTHVLRPTWHLIAAEDVYWMIALSAARIKAKMKTHGKQIGLDAAVFKKSNTLIEKLLVGDKSLTREEIFAHLEKAKIDTAANRGAHLLINAELDTLICNGPMQGKKQTYALLEERVPKPKPLSKDESLATLAKRYFLSHGPATLADFGWWSGLSQTEAKQGLDAVKSILVSQQVATETYWFSDSFSPQKAKGLFLLPAFDEYIISYKDRTASIVLERQKQTFTNNGIFKPVIVLDGQVIGIWKRSFEKNALTVETDFFQPQKTKLDNKIKKQVAALETFLGNK